MNILWATTTQATRTAVGSVCASKFDTVQAYLVERTPLPGILGSVS